MPLYLFDCKPCGDVFELLQGMSDPHEAVCPKCGQPAKRVYTNPQIKANKGFFSDDLGREVASQTDLQEGLDRQRYMQGMDGFVGSNVTPKDEWIEERDRIHQEELKETAAIDQENAEKYPDYYDAVETY